MKKKILIIIVIIFLLSVVYPVQVILSYILTSSDGWDGKKENPHLGR